ncbi:hypothetical protein B0H34DRAFT_708922 [Crassisporium funariophilum]|nr:hypothetical protein B0H34DRAFT_708922 [Crassisporium funariophilum]
MSHIAAFLALLALVAWASPTVGVMLTAGLAARFIHTWRPIHLDRNIPLGADDHQTIYLLATTSWWSEAMPNIKKVDDWYYFTGIMEKDDSEESE